MTSPGDDEGLEDELRRALSEAASGVEPNADGLDKIRARIAGRPPRPRLTSVLFGIVERVRNWTWRGHWAWPDRLSRLVEDRWPRLRRGSFPRRGTGSLRLAAVFAAVAVIASVTLGVQPLRNAILQASTALQGGGGTQRATVGTDANGAPTVVRGNGTSLPGGGQAGSGGTSPVTTTPSAVKPHKSAAACPTSTADTQVSLTNIRTSATATAATTPVVAATVTPAQSGAANATTVTCPVSPTESATPAPTASSGNWAPVSTPVTDYPTPTVSDPDTWPTPTATPSRSRYGWPSQSGSPSGSGQDQQPHDPRPGHDRRH
jgi:hypothetical protein